MKTASCCKAAILLALIAFGPVVAVGGELVTAHTVSYERDIGPLFAANCIKCHGPKKHKVVRLDTPGWIIKGKSKGDRTGPVIVPGKPDKSELVRLISLPANHDDRMPNKGDPLTAEQIALVRRWVEQGAVFDGEQGWGKKQEKQSAKHPAAEAAYVPARWSDDLLTLLAKDGCCAEAERAEKTCGHGCCADARAAGRICLKCNTRSANAPSPPLSSQDPVPAGRVTVEVLEGVPAKSSWKFKPRIVERYAAEGFALAGVPRKYSAKGLIIDRSNPYVLRTSARVTLPAGKYRLLLRSLGAARLRCDDEVLAETKFMQSNSSGHESVPELVKSASLDIHSPPAGHQEQVIQYESDGEAHDFVAEVFVGGRKLRTELGEMVVAVSPEGSDVFRILAPGPTLPFDEEAWRAYAEAQRTEIAALDSARRNAAGPESRYWELRHALARHAWSQRPALVVPDTRSERTNEVDRFVLARFKTANSGADSVGLPPLIGDAAFLRRLSLDVRGIIPTGREVEAFLLDSATDKRGRAIDRLLASPRWADHWVSYWQDVLAENPGILKPNINNTGPFRWWIHESFLDNKPMDRFVTELVMMEGSKYGGGPAGFSMATQNDVPMAAKAHILTSAFLGLEMKCARCHDAPHHRFKQEQLFSLAAMLGRKSIKVPSSSSLSAESLARKPRVRVTLKPGTLVKPRWPFPELAHMGSIEGLLRRPNDHRERLAAYITGSDNRRFPEIVVNRLWRRYFGWGLVDPVDDWEDAVPRDRPLLRYLSRELVLNGYDLKHVARLILNSQTYQRTVVVDADEQVLPLGPVRRRMSAEQLVDSLFQAAGKGFECEPISLDPEGRRPINSFLNLGVPTRAWQFASLSNERDRPAISLPMAQSFTDLLAAFGWRQSRQSALTVRHEFVTPTQALILANGQLSSRITRFTDDGAFVTLCLQDRELDELVRIICLRMLSRPPRPEERDLFVALLREGYKSRVTGKPATKRRAWRTAVSWANHLSPEATRLKQEIEARVRRGEPPTVRLHKDWRERMEDMVWALLNSPEFAFVP